MKTIALFLTSLVVTFSVRGQGFFIFGNTQSTGNITIHGGAPGEGAEGNFVGTGYNATLFWGPGSVITFSQLSSILPPSSTVYVTGSNCTVHNLSSSHPTKPFLGLASSQHHPNLASGLF